jgi:cytochrome c oxidase subunit 2
MAGINPEGAKRVLIASSHPLFGQGLRSLLKERREPGVQVVGMVSSVDEALEALERLRPDLVIVDYDDEQLNREEFLARFVEGEHKLRVVLLSLQSAGDALVYDRRQLSAAQVEDWLEDWAEPRSAAGKPEPRRGGVDRNEGDRRTGMKQKKHLIIAGVLIVVITALLILGMDHVRWLPNAASIQAGPIDALFHLEFKVMAFLFSLIVVLMVYSIVIFRRKKGDLSDAGHIEGNSRLEIFWTAVPLLTVLVLSYIGGKNLAETVRAAPDPVEINVIGQQWSWRFDYPRYGVSSTELVMPLDEQALLHLSSNDVIHSFWVPEFRVKQDLLPGGEQFVRDLRITPTEEGEYLLMCAEMCGLQHAYMTAPVRVVARTEFDSWLAQQAEAANADPETRGRQLSQQYGCQACHSLDGSILVGPTWKGLYGKDVELADGSTVVADDPYLHESIVDPGAKLVAGFPNVMPATYGDQLTDEQIADIIAFIESLK